jgi:hypothetical protein
VIPFPERPEEAAVRGALRSVRGRNSSMDFFRNLHQLGAGGAADLNAALRRGALEARRTGLAVVVSDFLDPEGYEEGLSALVGRGFQITLVQVLAPEELNPSTYGDLKLVDSETGGIQEVTFGRFRLKQYLQTLDSYCQRLREYCRTRGVRYFRAGSDTALEDLLLRQLREQEVWQ